MKEENTSYTNKFLIEKLLSIQRKGPYNNIIVVEIGQNVSGPQAAEDLARSGALVIKIENQASKGDPARYYMGKETFSTVNSGKASIAIGKDDAEFYYNTLTLAHVIIDNRAEEAKTKDNVLQKFLQSEKKYPVIFCSIIGYGKGFENKRALDMVVQADSGLAAVNGTDPSNPLATGTVIIDQYSATIAASAIKDQLYAIATKSCEIPKEHNNVINIEVSMAKVAATLLSGHYLRAKTTKIEPTRSSFVAPFGFYKSKDHQIAIAIVDDISFARFCKNVLQNESFATKYPSNKLRISNLDEFNKELSQILSEQNSEYWINLCQKNNIPCSKVNTILEAIEDNFYKACFTRTKDGVDIIGDPAICSNNTLGQHTPAPKLDEHREHIQAMINETKTSHQLVQLILQTYKNDQTQITTPK